VTTGSAQLLRCAVNHRSWMGACGPVCTRHFSSARRPGLGAAAIPHSRASASAHACTTRGHAGHLRHEYRLQQRQCAWCACETARSERSVPSTGLQEAADVERPTCGGAVGAASSTRKQQCLRRHRVSALFAPGLGADGSGQVVAGRYARAGWHPWTRFSGRVRLGDSRPQDAFRARPARPAAHAYLPLVRISTSSAAS
jgi:hypothetical protein